MKCLEVCSQKSRNDTEKLIFHGWKIKYSVLDVVRHQVFASHLTTPLHLFCNLLRRPGYFKKNEWLD